MDALTMFGEYFKELRIQNKYTLRKFCREFNLDAGNISKMERGILPPPGRDILEQYAKYLEISYGSSEWYKFFDLAAACSGKIPKDLQDEDIIAKLPVVFRTLRNKKVDEEQLQKFVEDLKKI